MKAFFFIRKFVPAKLLQEAYKQGITSTFDDRYNIHMVDQCYYTDFQIDTSCNKKKNCQKRARTGNT